MELYISAAKAASRVVARRAAIAASGILLVCALAFQAGAAQYDVIAGLGQFDWDTNFDGIADGWVLASDGNLKYDLRLVKHGVPSDGYAQQVRIRAAFARSGQVSLSRHVAVGSNLLIHEGDRIRGSAYIRTAVPRGGSVQADFACYDHNSQLTGLYYIMPETTLSDKTWRQYSVEFTVPPGTTQLSVNFRIGAAQGWGVGSLLVDNVQVSKEVAEIPTPPDGAIPMTLWNDPGADEVYSVKRYSCYMVEPDNYAYIRTYKTYNPGAPVFLRQLHAATAGPPDAALIDPIGYDWIDTYHPEWFLLDENGQRIAHQSNSNVYMLDPGNSSYQRVWAKTAIRNADACGADGVLIGGIVTGFELAGSRRPVKYPDDAS